MASFDILGNLKRVSSLNALVRKRVLGVLGALAAPHTQQPIQQQLLSSLFLWHLKFAVEKIV